MNGADSILQVAFSAGLDICFANPGTTELPIVSALDRVTRIRPVLCLAEAVCAGAADGYGRMTRKPALTLLHLGPGLANGLAYFHNARRAATPIINLIGDHASWHLSADAPLTSDIEALARPMSVWVKSALSSESLATDTAEAIHHAVGGVASLIVPLNHQAAWVSGEHSVELIHKDPQVLSGSHAQAVADALKYTGPAAALLLGGQALSEPGLRAAARITAVTGCKLLHETFPARVERGGSLPDVMRLPYMPTQAMETLGNYRLLVLAGAREPVSFFGHEGQRSTLVPSATQVSVLAPSPQDVYFDSVGALEQVSDILGGRAVDSRYGGDSSAYPTGPLDPNSFAATIAAVQPEDAIIVDESVTSGFSYNQASARSPRHTYLVPHVGGAIGHGLPLATGAALASPDRPVILLEADGSGMYTVQSLWTQAREQLNVTTIICANREYRILQLELGADVKPQPRSASDSLLSIDRPSINWVDVSIGLGVPAEAVKTADELDVALRKAIREPGPHLIEAVL